MNNRIGPIVKHVLNVAIHVLHKILGSSWTHQLTTWTNMNLHHLRNVVVVDKWDHQTGYVQTQQVPRSKILLPYVTKTRPGLGTWCRHMVNDFTVKKSWWFIAWECEKEFEKAFLIISVTFLLRRRRRCRRRCEERKIRRTRGVASRN